jgi:glycosyltransferase involved in cell wall biosynthesis
VVAASISVVIPVYDGERFLGEAIESVLAQSLPAAEVVVVDDGSSDRSAAVAEEFGPPVRVLRKPHRGVSAARNAGVAESGAELIAFLDADDRMKPDRLERQAAALAEAPAPAIALGREEVLSDPGLEPPPQLDEGRRYANPYTPMTLLAPRDAFDQVGPFDETMRMGQDTDWLLRALEAGFRPVLMEEALIVRRFHGGNLSYDWEGYRKAMWSILRRRAARQRAAGRPLAEGIPAGLLLGMPGEGSPLSPSRESATRRSPWRPP